MSRDKLTVSMFDSTSTSNEEDNFSSYIVEESPDDMLVDISVQGIILSGLYLYEDPNRTRVTLPSLPQHGGKHPSRVTIQILSNSSDLSTLNEVTVGAAR